jgi:hypothetical protein
MKISIPFEKYLAQQKIVGEMAGCLSMVAILCSNQQISKAEIIDLLERYEKVFNSDEYLKVEAKNIEDLTK